MLKKKKRKISNAGSSAERKAIRKNIRGYNKDVKKMQKLLPLYKNAILNCSKGKQDFDCNVYDYGFDEYDEEREVDLSTHARKEVDGSGEEIIPKGAPTIAPRIKIPE